MGNNRSHLSVEAGNCGSEMRWNWKMTRVCFWLGCESLLVVFVGALLFLVVLQCLAHLI